MANRAALQAVDSLLQALGGSTEPLRGQDPHRCWRFLLGGAPVVRGGGLVAVVDASVCRSPVWDHFHIGRLTTPMRNADDPEFYLYVDGIGEDVECCRNIVLQHLPSIPPHALTLKVGAIYTIARNLSMECGLAKNARVIIQQLNRYSVRVGILPLRPALALALPSASVDIQSDPLSRINFEFKPPRLKLDCPP